MKGKIEMIKETIHQVDLFFLEWDELKKYVGCEVILFNTQKPWLGFYKVDLESMGENSFIIDTREMAFNKIAISRDEYLRDYKIANNLFWHGFGEKDLT